MSNSDSPPVLSPLAKQKPQSHGIYRVLVCALILCLGQYAFLEWLTQGKGDPAEMLGRLFGSMLIPVLIVGFFNRKRAWSYVATFLALFLISGIFFLADVGRKAREKGENAQKAEQTLQQTVGLFNELAETLEQVKDEASAKEATLRVQAIVSRFKQMAESARQLPKVSSSDMQRLEQTYGPKIEEAGRRVKKAAETSAAHFEDQDEILKSFQELQGLFLRMQEGK